MKETKSRSLDTLIYELCQYGEAVGLIHPLDRAYVANRLLALYQANSYTEPSEPINARPLADILQDMTSEALARGLIAEDGVVFRDLFDTEIMGILTPMPSTVVSTFRQNYASSPAYATDAFYRLALVSNYIREDRIRRDIKWVVPSAYGEIEISINLSKPEKDPKAIAAAKKAPQSGYPLCLLCHENEGFAGTLDKPARQNLRQIPLTITGEEWYLQYSPYVYYNEHCILLSAKHTPMSVSRKSFEKELDFVEILPHYFIGQNADLPIVGGSILSHDHMQGGRHSFPMEKAPIVHSFSVVGFEDVNAGIVKWPMSVIRLSSENKERLVALADKILLAWRKYSDASVEILADTTEPHNTITPIARRRGKLFELDLVLRNNRTSEEHPLGIFHPHECYHNIKKENIGLIEVMGLAILPARLKSELAVMETAILSGIDFAEVPKIQKHRSWFLAFRDKYTFTKENTMQILREEVGRTFVGVLTDAGVYKDTPEGFAAFLRFIDSLNQ